jgi:hypothetical protein
MDSAAPYCVPIGAMPALSPKRQSTQYPILGRKWREVIAYCVYAFEDPEVSGFFH